LGEKVRISDEAERVQSASYPRIRLLYIYNVIVSNANWWNWWSSAGLGLIVYISMFPYAYKLKIKFQLQEEGIGIMFFVGF